MSSHKTLSIVIPAYNEEKRLPESLEQIAKFVGEQSYSVEVVVVDNNSKDQTGDIAREFARMFPYARALAEPRQGKGAAVRTGMLAGCGEYLLICDADFSMPVEEISKFVPPAASGYDVAIEVDGGIGGTTIGAAARAGADVFCAGSALFTGPGTLEDRVAGLRRAAEIGGAAR